MRGMNLKQKVKKNKNILLLRFMRKNELDSAEIMRRRPCCTSAHNWSIPENYGWEKISDDSYVPEHKIYRSCG